MASYTVKRIKHATLSTGVEDDVTFTEATDSATVINHGTVPIYFTVDGTTPTLAGDEIYVCNAGINYQISGIASKTSTGKPPAVVVKLLASASCAYTVLGNA